MYLTSVHAFSFSILGGEGEKDHRQSMTEDSYLPTEYSFDNEIRPLLSLRLFGGYAISQHDPLRSALIIKLPIINNKDTKYKENIKNDNISC